jgi:putative membrane protein
MIGIPVMNMSRITRLAFAFALLPSADGIASSQTANAPAGEAAASSVLGAVDYNFVAQANLGAPFQIDSGRIAEKKATTPNIRDYAHLMVVTDLPVVDALKTVLQQKHIVAPPNTLLHGAYDTMIASLEAEHGVALDRDYVQGQGDYQKGNLALFQYEIQNGTDPDLKEFARYTLPKIEDHPRGALSLAKNGELRTPDRQPRRARGKLRTGNLSKGLDPELGLVLIRPSTTSTTRAKRLSAHQLVTPFLNA